MYILWLGGGYGHEASAALVRDGSVAPMQPI